MTVHQLADDTVLDLSYYLHVVPGPKDGYDVAAIGPFTAILDDAIANHRIDTTDLSLDEVGTLTRWREALTRQRRLERTLTRPEGEPDDDDPDAEMPDLR